VWSLQATKVMAARAVHLRSFARRAPVSPGSPSCSSLSASPWQRLSRSSAGGVAVGNGDARRRAVTSRGDVTSLPVPQLVASFSSRSWRRRFASAFCLCTTTFSTPTALHQHLRWSAALRTGYLTKIFADCKTVASIVVVVWVRELYYTVSQKIAPFLFLEIVE